ncbi:uncharacterized protein ARMOST_07350 [Armillaria ostoyae]|uniref:Glucanase n=1 Tax=Armillaria ostoyae TaxID=47428 RepID=A0A284R5K0_ARMOS|nr:uncharacterized protein ARMOST_07350 [Armillaria ostoyae]
MPMKSVSIPNGRVGMVIESSRPALIAGGIRYDVTVNDLAHIATVRIMSALTGHVNHALPPDILIYVITEPKNHLALLTIAPLLLFVKQTIRHVFPKVALLFLALAAVVYGQQVGTLTAENHPTLQVQTCTSSSSCTTQSSSITLDSNWRWTHQVSGSTSCYTGNTWDTSICPDPVTCAINCALDGADYAGTYGIKTSGDALTLKFVTRTILCQYRLARVLARLNRQQVPNVQPEEPWWNFQVPYQQGWCQV